MKSILLASVASFAFAGVAAAEVTFSGSAELGYNNFDHDGATPAAFYSDADLAIKFEQALDNGLTAGAKLALDIQTDTNADSPLTGVDYELSLTSDMAGMYYGKTATASEAKYTGGVGIAADGLFLTNEHSTEAADGTLANSSQTLRGELSYSVVDAAVSYRVNTGAATIDGFQGAAAFDLAGAAVQVAYQEAAGLTPNASADARNAAQAFGVNAAYTFAGATLTGEYARVETAAAANGAGDGAFAVGNYFGIGISYPVGPVTLGAAYADNAGTDDWEVSAAYASGPISISAAYSKGDTWDVDASYAYGSGISFYAGLVDTGEDWYVAGSYDLGAGAAVLVSYANDGDNDGTDDEIGANDYKEGTTVEVSFKF